jgi:hypothetical protein
MLKLSDRIPEEKKNPLNSSYTNSAFSEYIGCHILESAGFDVQKTLLGNLTVVGRNGMDRVHPVVACENFVPDGYSLVEFKTIESALLSRKPPKIPEIDDIYGILTHENAYFGKEFGEQALEQYWDLFIMDALLGNFDRHANNWGYLVNDRTGDIQFAPVYDCGSCLYPQLTDDALGNILNSRDEIQMRIEKFPQAALTGEDGKKISYLRYIASFENPDCTEALLRVFPRINLSEINRIVDTTEGISDIRKTFYKTMLAERYEQILERPFEQCHSLVHERKEQTAIMDDSVSFAQEDATDERFEALKDKLFAEGLDAISDFLGYECDPDWDDDMVENAMDEAYAQIPDNELEEFYRAYHLKNPCQGIDVGD